MELHDATPAVVTRPRRRPAHDSARTAHAKAPHLRPYQVEAQQAILEHRARGVRSQLVSLATGLGKSVVIATLPRLLSLRTGDVTVVVAHRDELIEQLVDKFSVENPDALIGVEKAERRASEDCSIVVATVQTLDEVASRGGDFGIGQRAQAVNIGQRNERIVAAYKQNTPGLKALVFTASVEHARDVAEEFVARGVNAEWASGETPREERERIVRDFRGDGIDVLVNCGLYLEGFDVPSGQVILNARPTKSTTLYSQITGRALRPLDEIASPLSNTNSGLERRELIEKSSKPAAIVIDLVDQAQRHQLVTVPSLYGLPPHIDAQGQMTAQVADKFEELLRRDPKRAAKVRTAEEIETALVEIDAFNGPREIKPTFQPIDPESHWRLEMPSQRTAYDRKGRPIPDFSRKWDQWVAEARRVAPHEDAERFANRMLDVNQKSVRWERRRIDVKRDGDKFVTLYSTEELPERVIEVGSSLVGLLGSAYQRVDEMLSGYAQVPGTNGTAARPAAAAPPHHAGTEMKNAGNRRRRGRRARPR